MQLKPGSQTSDQKRSEFIRTLVQRPSTSLDGNQRRDRPPRTIVQFWHDLRQLPSDIGECIESWRRWELHGFTHVLVDSQAAQSFIQHSLGTRHAEAFGRCYHPAMQADYFRLCYVLVEGGFYVDADDIFVGGDIRALFEDGRLRLQPLCYEMATQSMVRPAEFLASGADNPQWIFYFNNNPLIASAGHPVVQRALEQATDILVLSEHDVLPEIQSTTGPGNLSKAVFDLYELSDEAFGADLVVLRDWDTFALSKWPLSYRNDARNWRLSNQRRFVPGG
jgi:mannosyltransferase OCH1-like enzyme